jgi:L-rhamnose mutarotase
MLPRQSEWEETVSRFQKTTVSSSAKEKWKLIERIYKLDQTIEHNVEQGYLEEIGI